MVKPTMPTVQVQLDDCASRHALDLIADKWTVVVFFVLEGGPKRFSELRRAIVGVSQKMLTQTLRAMERDGFVRREVYPLVPPVTEYSLTPLGRTLVEPMATLRHWAAAHGPAVEQARRVYDGRPAWSASDRPPAP